jgi:hypothetical protein
VSDTSVVFSILATERVTETLDSIPGAALLSGAAIGMALMGGISKAMDQESASNMLAAQLGATPEMSASFGRIAGDLYSQNFGDSVADIDAALKGVWQNGLVPEDATDAELQAVTGKVINSAKMMGASYDEVSRTVSQMLRTGMAKSADEAFDVITRGMQQGVDKSQDLLDTFNEYPTQFRKLGLDGTSAMGLLSQAIKAGARDSDVAADALKEFSIRAVDGSKTTADGFKALGLNAKQMSADIGAGGERANGALDKTLDRLRAIKDPTTRAQVAVQLFGTQAEDLGDALFAMDPSKAVDTMGQVEGAADKAGQTLSQGAGAQIESFRRKLEQGFVEVVGGKVIPHLDKFGATIQKIGAWGKDNWEWLGPVLVFLGTLAGIIGTIILAVKVWTAITAAYTAVQAALNVVMMANPIGLIIIAVVALVAAIIYLWTHSAAFRDFFIGVWEAIWGFIKGVGHWFAHDFVGFFKGAWNWIKDTTLGFLLWVNSKIQGFLNFIGAIPGNIRKIGSTMWNGITDSFKSAINFLIRGWNALDFGINISIPDWVPGLGGKGFSIKDVIPDLPYLDVGGDVLRSGLAVIHAGERVVPAAQVRSLPAGGGGITEMRVTGNGGLALLVKQAIRTGEILLFDSNGKPISVST